MWNWLGGAAPPVEPPADAPTTGDDKEEGGAAAEGAVEGAVEGGEGAGTEKGVADELDVGIATENVKQVASKLGSYLYGFASAATSTASKLKDTAAGCYVM